jgi:hypothetical protein
LGLKDDKERRTIGEDTKRKLTPKVTQIVVETALLEITPKVTQIAVEKALKMIHVMIVQGVMKAMSTCFLIFVQGKVWVRARVRVMVRVRVRVRVMIEIRVEVRVEVRFRSNGSDIEMVLDFWPSEEDFFNPNPSFVMCFQTVALTLHLTITIAITMTTTLTLTLTL